MTKRSPPALAARRARHVHAGLALLLVAAGCGSIPEPESPGGKLYAQRCASGCHRLYQPRVLKYEMWKTIVRRMQGEFVRRGLPPLTEAEQQLLLQYLEKHASH